MIKRYIFIVTLIGMYCSNNFSMLNPNAYIQGRKHIPTGSSYRLDEKERERLEKLATTPLWKASSESHLDQIKSAQQRVFSHWPEERLPHVFEMLSENSKEEEKQEAKPQAASVDLVQDLSPMVHGQTGETCGYHAVYNIDTMLAALKHKYSEETLKKRLKQGPPMEEWQNFIHGIFKRKSNINDEEMTLLISKKTTISPEEITLISNLRDWDPSLDESFQTIAQNLQQVPGTIHGFLINTGGHISKMTPAIHHQIIKALSAKPHLQKLFKDNMNPTLTAHQENEILKELAPKKLPILISAVSNINEKGKQSEHCGFGGHWTATVIQNDNGSLKAYIADSGYTQGTNQFDNMSTVEEILSWITIDPHILNALRDIPHRIESAKNILEVNGDIEGATERLQDIMAIVHQTAGLEKNIQYIDRILPEIEYLSEQIIGSTEKEKIIYI